jgi:hypothetical protein
MIDGSNQRISNSTGASRRGRGNLFEWHSIEFGEWIDPRRRPVHMGNGNKRPREPSENGMRPYHFVWYRAQESLDTSHLYTASLFSRRRVLWGPSTSRSRVSSSAHSKVVVHSYCLLVKTGEPGTAAWFATGSSNTSRVPALTGDLGEVQALKPCPFRLVQPAPHRVGRRTPAMEAGVPVRK